MKFFKQNNLIFLPIKTISESEINNVLNGITNFSKRKFSDCFDFTDKAFTRHELFNDYRKNEKVKILPFDLFCYYLQINFGNFTHFKRSSNHLLCGYCLKYLLT